MLSGTIHCGISNHNIIFLVKKKIAPKSESTCFEGRSYRDLDIAKLQDDLTNLNWSPFYDCVDHLSVCWDIMLKNITTVADRQCPLKKIKVKQIRLPWVNHGILETINDRDNALKLFERTKNPTDWTTYKRLRNEVKRGVREAREYFTVKTLERTAGDHKKFWKVIQDIFPRSNSSCSTFTLIDQKDNNEVPSSQTADYINSFFATIGQNLALSFTDTWVAGLPRTNFELTNVITNEREVDKLVREINIYKASSVENLSTKLLKPAFMALVPHLTFLFNLCLLHAIFPNKWKIATVIPLQKDRDKTDVGNLRPISLLTYQESY